MSFAKTNSKKPRKLQVLLLLLGLTVLLIVLTLLLLNNGLQDVIKQHLLYDAGYLLRVQVKNGQQWASSSNPTHRNLSTDLRVPAVMPLLGTMAYTTTDVEQHITTMAVHIFYMAPVPWYKTRKPSTSALQPHRTPVASLPDSRSHTVPPDAVLVHTQKGEKEMAKRASNAGRAPKILNSAFYPALGLYKSTPSLLRQHFASIQKCGIGVIILSCCSIRPADRNIQKSILELAPTFNLSVTFEVSVAGNQTFDYLEQQLLDLREYSHLPGFYRVYSQSGRTMRPLLYISNAYKLFDSLPSKVLCHHKEKTPGNSLRHIMDALFIAHIRFVQINANIRMPIIDLNFSRRLKNHADLARRLCFDGFYSKLASNGATFASTWKNWSYLKSFANTYKMLFIPTVGPGFAERHKFPRHGDIQRHRSNGRVRNSAFTFISVFLFSFLGIIP